VSSPAGSGSVTLHAHRVTILPATRLGWWSVALMVAHVVLVLAWSVLPGGAGLGFACGVAGGSTALVAVRRRGERAILVYAAIVPLALVVLFVLAELLIGHG